MYMKAVLPVFMLLLRCGLPFSGKATAPVTLEAGKITNPVICQADASQSYAVYIPAKGNADALPVIYFFDSHGNGALPLTKYKTLADEYGFILVGSNNSKNGNDWPATGNIWQQLYNDTQKRLKINGNRLYTCGFSGGAKVASYVALKSGIIKSVIANGAGLPDGTAAGNFTFSFTAITGSGDMNMTELVTLNNQLDNTTTRHRILIFDGIHEWAPAATMGLAFGSLQLDAMQLAILAKNDAYINGYVAQSKQRFNTCYQANQLIKAAQECTFSINVLGGLTGEIAWFKQKAAGLATNTAYRQQQQQQQTILTNEQGFKTTYMQQFEQGDMAYWQKTVHSLQIQATAKTAEGAMYQRLLAWLSLAFYSISNQLINGNQNVQARHFVNLYQLVDATNSEAWYFSAILNARDKQARAAENDLVKATVCGFNDKARMEGQPEFKQPGIDLKNVEAKMR